MRERGVRKGCGEGEWEGDELVCMNDEIQDIMIA